MLKSPTSRRKFLLFIRGGSGSVHRKLYPLGQDRDWDILFSSYEGFEDRDFEEADFLVIGGNSKWQDLAWFLAQEESKYQLVWVSDDDIDFGGKPNIGLMFRLTLQNNLWVAQPSLSAESHCSWRICRNSPSSILRFSTFVECMTPIFSAYALEKLREDIAFATSGCGLDLIFWHALGRPANRVAIVDAVQVDHTRPIDTKNGSFYNHLRRLGVNPRIEINHFLEKYGLIEAKIHVTGMIPLVERHPRFSDTNW